MRKYTAEIGGHQWKQGPTAEFGSLAECREWAASYGTTADWCLVTDRLGRPVVGYQRDYRRRTGDGSRWFRTQYRIDRII